MTPSMVRSRPRWSACPAGCSRRSRRGQKLASSSSSHGSVSVMPSRTLEISAVATPSRRDAAKRNSAQYASCEKIRCPIDRHHNDLEEPKQVHLSHHSARLPTIRVCGKSPSCNVSNDSRSRASMSVKRIDSDTTLPQPQPLPGPETLSSRSASVTLTRCTRDGVRTQPRAG